MQRFVVTCILIVVNSIAFGLSFEVWSKGDLQFFYPVGGSETSLFPAYALEATVEGLVDADTLLVKFEDGRLAYVELPCADAPESGYAKGVAEPFGIAAAVFGKLLLTAQTPLLLKFLEDAEEERKVPRAHVWFAVKKGEKKENVWLSYELTLISNGYAKYVSGNASCSELATLFNEAERTAKKNKLGMWGDSPESEVIQMLFFKSWPPPLSQFDKEVMEGPIEILVKILHINAVTKDEYVVIANLGTEPVDLKGWTLWSRGGQRFVFPALVLKPGQRVSIHSGPAATGLVWTTRYVWNNEGDEARLYNNRGVLISEYRYGR